MAESDLAAERLVAAADGVVTELQKSPLPRQAKAALAGLAAGELGPWTRSWSPFRCLYGFQEWRGSLDHFPDWPGAVDPATGRPTHAFGPWQDQPRTYAEIAAMTGRAGVNPQDLVANNWVLAVRDYKAHSGGDLLAALITEQLEDVAAALRATWPGGADAGFPDRYRAALPLFDMPAPSGALAIAIPLGMQFSCPISGTLMGHPVPVPADALRADDPSVCTVAIADGRATFAAVTLGRTRVTGADLALDVTAVAAEPDHLELDQAHGAYSKIAAGVLLRVPLLAAVAALALGLLAQPAGSPERILRSEMTPKPCHQTASASPALAQSSFYFVSGPDGALRVVDRCLGG